MKKIFILIHIFGLAAFLLPGQQGDGALKSLSEERRDIIKFGIESEITELLGTLKAEKDETLVPEIAIILKGAAGKKITGEIFEYLRLVKRSEGIEPAEQYLKNHEDTPPDLLVTVLRYLSEMEEHGKPELVYPILDSKQSQLVSAAVRYLGKKPSSETADRLLGVFENRDTGLQQRGEIILALGELKDPATVPFLADILDDEDEDPTLRRFACDSLGKIADVRALPGIRKALDSGDNILRAYAVSALGNFPGEETMNILLTSLRDSFPRVRELAAERLGDLRSEEAVDILIYRAGRDPEKRVRLASFRSLSRIGNGKAVGFLREYLEGERNAQEFRILAAEELAERHPDAIEKSADKIMTQEWSKDNSVILDAICKIMSQKEHAGFGQHFEKMLQHRSFIIQIYGIRGIQKNGLSRFRTQVEEFTKDKYHPQLRRTAMTAMERL